jgi:uncharacterized membrane protein YdjX (TVP38/TMEM64 family)
VTATSTSRLGPKLKLGLVLCAIAVLLAGAKYFGIQVQLVRLLDWIRGLGAWGPILFILIYIVACVLFVPGSLLTLGGGFLFGLKLGFICVSVGATLGAVCAFLVGRHFARGWVAGKVERNEKFKAVDDAVAREGWKIVLLTRLSPVFPFNLMNYAFGITRVSLRGYFLASWIGMMPGALLYVYLGSLAGSLTALNGARHDRTPAEWALYAIGLAATIAVTIFVTRIAKKALAERIPIKPNET